MNRQCKTKKDGANEKKCNIDNINRPNGIDST